MCLHVSSCNGCCRNVRPPPLTKVRGVSRASQDPPKPQSLNHYYIIWYMKHSSSSCCGDLITVFCPNQILIWSFPQQKLYLALSLVDRSNKGSVANDKMLTPSCSCNRLYFYWMWSLVLCQLWFGPKTPNILTGAWESGMKRKDESPWQMEMVKVRHEFEDGIFAVKVRVRILGKGSSLWK